MSSASTTDADRSSDKDDLITEIVDGGDDELVEEEDDDAGGGVGDESTPMSDGEQTSSLVTQHEQCLSIENALTLLENADNEELSLHDIEAQIKPRPSEVYMFRVVSCRFNPVCHLIFIGKNYSQVIRTSHAA